MIGPYIDWPQVFPSSRLEVCSSCRKYCAASFVSMPADCAAEHVTNRSKLTMTRKICIMYHIHCRGGTPWPPVFPITPLPEDGRPRSAAPRINSKYSNQRLKQMNVHDLAVRFARVPLTGLLLLACCVANTLGQTSKRE